MATADSLKQEIFDKVATHLLAQGKRSVTADALGDCMYRGPDGLKCAVGCLITDECYTPKIEKKLVTDNAVIAALACSGVTTNKGVLDLLYGLQELHDETPVEDWPRALRNVAEMHDLKFSGRASQDSIEPQ